MNWLSPNSYLNNLQHQFSAQLERRQKTHPHCFPDIRADQELIIAVDYSGEHSESKFDVTTFLLADRPGILASWDLERQLIRDKHLSGNRRHAFKSLGDGQRQRALGPFLKASSEINGIVLSVGFDKSIGDSILGFELPDLGEVKIKPNTVAKLVRSAFFGSILLAGLGRADQSLKWITDDDAIVGNEEIQDFSFSLINSMVLQCCPFELHELSFGIASKFDDDYRAEDLCSIPDLVGGAIADTLNLLPKDGIPKTAPLYTPVMQQQSIKSTLILSWFANSNVSLKNVFCLVRPDENDTFRISFGDPRVTIGTDLPRTFWIPPDPKWQRNLRPRH